MKRAALPFTLAVTLALGGCGQKGPLYLPDKKPQVVAPPAAAQPAAAMPAPTGPQTAPAAQPKPNDKDQDAPAPPK